MVSHEHAYYVGNAHLCQDWCLDLTSCRRVTKEEEDRYRAARGGDEGEDAGPAHRSATPLLTATAL
jgi:hypothetical protein